MADPAAIARRALELANRYLQTETKQIADMADGDMNALREAADIIHNQSEPHARAPHMAFTLITAAYDSLRDKTE